MPVRRRAIPVEGPGGVHGQLLLVGAARRLTTGTALGTDTWAAKDLSNNAPTAAQRNAAIEGVSARATVETADARALPMPDATFDRVLKPGGTALVADYVPTSGYAAAFREAGLHVVGSRPHFGTALSLMWMVHATKPP